MFNFRFDIFLSFLYNFKIFENLLVYYNLKTVAIVTVYYYGHYIQILKGWENQLYDPKMRCFVIYTYIHTFVF